MDWIIWLVVIVVIVAVIWWLLNRTSRGSAGPSAAAETGRLADTGADTAAAAAASTPEPGTAALSGTNPSAAVAAEPAPAPVPQARPAAGELRPEPRTAEGAEWETHWSETPPQEPHVGGTHEPARGEPTAADRPGGAGQAPAEGAAASVAPASVAPVHHPEYTGRQAPTLPGAESAAAEDSETAGVKGTTEPTGATQAAAPAAAPSRPEPAAPSAVAAEVPGLPPAEAETLHTATSVAGPGTSAGRSFEPSAGTIPEPSGHLALEQPYGEGSAAPAADGSGPEDFTVKADASSMTYYEETSPVYGEIRAEVWFLSPAHAEAAGFRPPRRTRR